LPLLTKSEVKNNLDLIVNPIIDRKSLIWRHTSGTTGSGLVFPEVASTEHFTWAFWWRYRRMHGIVPSMRCGYFGGRSLVPLSVTQPPFWRYNHPGNQLMLSCYHLNHKTARDYLEALVDYDVQWLHGYPSILSLLSRYIQEQNLEVSLPRLRIITTGAENLTLAQRNSIAEVFNVPVVQHYGQAEAVANISECSHGALHVDEDFSCVEFVENPTDPGTCRLVGTNWLNPAFPLFRYDTGDVVVMGAGSCPCGNSGRLIHSMDGRMEDYLVLPNGTRIGRLDHIFKNAVHVNEAQFVQEDPWNITIRIVRGAGFSSIDESKLRREISQRIGVDANLRFEYIESIPRTRNGKLRLVVSKMKQS